ncbi:MAG: hypothetical protein HYW01_09635 [Deltaproteobacteria bacterium]|nr:hypothetical protein [Deltaproteobacteria bacterium]
MKTTEPYIKAKYEDKIVFTNEKETKSQVTIIETWKRSQGIWKGHPIFGNMSIKKAIEWLRGEDSDV